MKKGRIIFFSALTVAILLLFEITVAAQSSVANGNENYKTVKINDQLWMLENLNAVTFRNGDTITQAVTDEAWIAAGKEGKPVWCYYENNIANGSRYGKLYNWYAVNDSRGLAPKGWHIPSDKEWSMTTLFLGGEDAAGTKMKSLSGWTHNGNGTNESGFSGLPAGSRNRFGKFDYAGHITYWWCTTEYDADFAWYRAIDESPYYVYRTNFYKQNGYSVRCIKD